MGSKVDNVSEQVYVEIVERAMLHGAQQVEKRLGPMGQSAADKVQRGVEINLNHQKYYVRQVRT